MTRTDLLDARILKVLDRGPSHPSEIARETGILRTKIHYRLERLKRAGRATMSKAGRKSIWQRRFPATGAKDYFQLYREEDIVAAYSQLLRLPSGSEILSIQGTGAIEGELRRLPASFIKEAHRVFKRKRIILKGISNEKSLALFEYMEKHLVHSHIGRSVGLKILSGRNFLGAGEIMATKTLVLLANPSKNYVVIIKEKGIAELIYETLRLLLETLDRIESFNLNAHLEKILKKD